MELKRSEIYYTHNAVFSISLYRVHFLIISEKMYNDQSATGECLKN